MWYSLDTVSIPIHTISDLEFRRSIAKIKRAIVPIGSLEQHGEHLPVCTDSLIAESIAKLVATKIGSFVLPPLYYGVSYEHSPMFNISLSHSTLSRMISDVCLSLGQNGIKNIFLLNAHHGNTGALQYIGQDVIKKMPSDAKIFSLNYWQLMTSEFDHAGEVETSLVLALSPDLVKMKRAKSNKKNLSKSKAAYSVITNNPGSFPQITGNGIWGNPRNATVRKGCKLLDEIVANISRVILYELE
jgi:creatinine amidohydrolase